MSVTIKSLTIATQATTSATIAVTTSESPVTTAVGDLVVVFHLNDFYTLAAMTSPPTATGSPTVNPVTGGQADAGTNGAHIKAYWYKVNTAGAQTITATETGTHDEEKVLVAIVLAGADTTTAIDGTAGNAASLSAATPIIAPAATPATTTAYLITIIGGVSNSTYTTPAPLTEQTEFNVGNFLTGVIATEQLSASGSTGTFSFTPTTSSPFAAVTLAVLDGGVAAETGGGGTPAWPGRPGFLQLASGFPAYMQQWWRPPISRRGWGWTDDVVSADVTLTGVTGNLVLAAPAGTVSTTLPGVTGSVVLAAPAGMVSVSIPGPTAAVVLAAPPGAASVALPGVTATLVLAAPAGGFSTLTNFSANGVTAAVTFAAPAGTVSTSLPGVTAAVVLAAPAGKVSTTLPGVTAALAFAANPGSVAVSLPGATGHVVLAAPAGAVSTTLPGVTAALVFAAPVGSVTTGSGFSANGVTAAVTFTANPGTVSTTLPGVTATVVLAAPAGAVATGANFSAPGVTAALTITARVGSVSVTIPGATAGVALASPAGRVSVTLPGPTATIILTACAGGVAVPHSAAGVTAALVLTAHPGTATALVTTPTPGTRIAVVGAESRTVAADSAPRSLAATRTGSYVVLPEQRGYIVPTDPRTLEP